MLVTIATSFDLADRRYIAGQDVDVDRTVALRWIAEGKATTDANNAQNPVPDAVQALVSQAGILPGQRRASDGTMLWDFSTLTGYSVNNSGTIALVDSPLISARLGKTTAKSIQFTIPAGTNSEISFPQLAVAPQIPNQSLALVLEMTAGDTGAQALVNWFMGTDGTYANSYLRSDQINQHGAFVSSPIQGTTLQHWVPTLSPTFSTLRNGKVRITAGTAAVTVIMHGVLAAQSCPPAVCLIHDDNDVTAFTELRPRLDRYGFKCGFAVINDLVGAGVNYMTWAQIDQLYQEGHDMHPHGQFNLNTYGSAALAQADILKNRAALLNRGYTRGQEIYVYPNGNSEFSTTDRNSIRDYLKSLGFKAAFRASGTVFHPAGKGAGALDLPRYALNATINTTTLFNTLDSALESARALCGMVHVVLPSGATGSDINRADLDTVLAGLATRQASGSLRVVAPSECVNLMGAQAWV